MLITILLLIVIFFLLMILCPLLVLQLSHHFEKNWLSVLINNNFTHVQGNNILSLLKTHSCFHNLLKDVRTLINTPRDKVITSKVDPG